MQQQTDINPFFRQRSSIISSSEQHLLYTYETRKTTSTTFFLTEATLTSVVSVLICCKTDRICKPLVNTNWWWHRKTKFKQSILPFLSVYIVQNSCRPHADQLLKQQGCGLIHSEWSLENSQNVFGSIKSFRIS